MYACLYPLVAVCFALPLLNVRAAQSKPWPIRAVIVTTFQVDNNSGDAVDEFRFWVEREHLDEVIEFPGGVHPLRTNKEHTVLGMVSGTTLVNATASMMALGLDPRFDLTKAYFLINGVAGVDPNAASIGSAAWADYVVGDVMRSIDPREAPADWPYGAFPIGATGPNPKSIPTGTPMRSNLYTTNAKLAAWAYGLTKDLKLGDDAAVAEFRAGFTGFPNAQRPPFVLVGATFASDQYWHGTIATKFAEDWVKLWSGGKGTFAMTAMEDSGFMEALERLDRMHRVDLQRVMVLRTASNYSMPRPGHTAVESVTGRFVGMRLALESAWLCGSTVLRWILAHWDRAAGQIPGR
jgi:purine nucleoside permease